jgi:hypothetical protein
LPARNLRLHSSKCAANTGNTTPTNNTMMRTLIMPAPYGRSRSPPAQNDCTFETHLRYGVAAHNVAELVGPQSLFHYSALCHRSLQLQSRLFLGVRGYQGHALGPWRIGEWSRRRARTEPIESKGTLRQKVNCETCDLAAALFRPTVSGRIPVVLNCSETPRDSDIAAPSHVTGALGTAEKERPPPRRSFQPQMDRSLGHHHLAS